MPKVQLTGALRLQAGSTPEDIRSYVGGPGDEIDVPEDIALIIVGMGSGSVALEPGPDEPPKPKARRAKK